MHLASLTLKGFKSFADRTKLVLEPGVSVIVGPNGSGKSNITDAVLWVLGEQSAKSLRGNAMEDVIFAGSSARQAVGIAEVDLVLDNTAGELPLEFSEVTITRRMFRSGESEYLINHAPSRLIDVQELLHDTGLGRDTHSIISQGRIDEVLNARPEERRALIEEAAGILKHKKRKDRALRKLASMDVHVDRVRDVITEIDRQLRPLQRQADRASEYRDLSGQLRDLEVALAVHELRGLQGSWDEVVKREKEQDAEVELARYRQSEKERDLEKFQHLLEEKGLFVGDLSEQRRRLQSILERLNSGLLLLEEKGKNLVDKLSELRAKVHHSETRLVQRRAELDEISADRSASEGALKALYARLSELRREAEAVKKHRLASEEELVEANGAIRKIRKEIDDARTELTTVDQSLAAVTLESGMLRERLDTIASQRSELAETLSARRARADSVSAKLAATKKDLTVAEGDVDKRVRVLTTRKSDLSRLRDDLASIRAEVLALEEVERAFNSASPALAWLLARRDTDPQVLGTMGDHLTASSENEALLEQVLGADLSCVLLRDARSTNPVVAALEESAAGEFSLLPLPTRAPAPADAPGTPLAELVACDDSVRPAFDALAGDVRVVATLAEALKAHAKHPAVRFATTNGFVVFPNGKITKGAPPEHGDGVLARKRRLAELRDGIATAETAVGEAEALVAEAEEAVAAAQQDALDLSQTAASLTGEAASFREELGRLEQALTGFDAEETQLDAKLRTIDDRTRRDAPRKDQVQQLIQDGEQQLGELEEAAARRREERDNRFRDEAAVSNRLAECQVEIATVSERERHLKRRYASTAAEIEELTATLDQSHSTEGALETLRDRIQPLHDLYTDLLTTADEWAAKLLDRTRFEQADSESLRGTIHTAQDALKAASSEVETLSTAMNLIQVEKAQLEVKVNTAASRIVEDLGVSLEASLQAPPIEDLDRTKEAAHRLRKRISNMGPVNPVAVEEFAALTTRRDFMQTQLDDLTSSRRALQKVVAAIDRKMRDRFTETFELVDTHFQEIFSVLFPGGSAALRLTDPDEPDETGVEVVAQPVGKRLQRMSLLSGGEKSLTALALLFAVYRTRPCPFYILDEVEAALDDVNLRRFIAFVDGMRGHTQFIVITHQRRTMETADALYGVSMQADGVSKVVSQRIHRRARAEESSDDRAMV